MIYSTSDLHFNHSNIIRYCNRPFLNTFEMNTALINNWNKVVTDSDLIFILGDFSMRDTTLFESQLNGTKVFLWGNHDRQHALSSLFVISNGLHIFMQHKPYIKEVPKNTNLILCGHIHDRWKAKWWHDIPMINVGTDMWDYKPVSLDTIKAYALTLPKEASDRDLCECL
jgi:calcineurin-like phosphoesterase family protein